MDAVQPRFVVGLYGPFGWGNLGDAAIQESMLHNIRRLRPEARFVGFSLNPDNTEEIHGIPSVAILRSWKPKSRPVPESAPAAAPSDPNPRPPDPSRPPRLKRLLRPLAEAARELRFIARGAARLRDIDVLVISGGGQISDDWGGPWDHPYTMLKWVLAAKAVGTRVVIVSVGAGPFRRSFSGTLFRWALRLADYRSYRDEESKQFLSRAAFTLPARVYPDLAFGHPPHPGARGPARPLRVGVSPMCYFHPTPGAWPEQNPERYRRYLTSLTTFAAGAGKAGHPLVIFTSQIRNDRYAFDDLLAALDPAELAGVAAMPTEGLSHLLEQIAGCDVVITSRLHGVILAYLHHRPVISLSYDPKISSVMRQFGQSGFCLEIDRCTPERLAERFEAVARDYDRIRGSIQSTADAHRSRLEEQFDHLFGRKWVGSGPSSG